MRNISRREFFGVTAATAVTLGAAACTRSSKSKVEKEDSGEMQFRMNGSDKVSLLGYGCMRWPMVKDENGKDIVDQQKVNELVDIAIANGVNYFDSSPQYLQGQSETATGIALRRHPRESYFIATKLSNFADFSREGSMKMYNESFRIYQTDHIDYYLLHNIGSYQDLKKRFEDNGMMDFLLEERKKGRIRNLGFSLHGSPEGFDSILALHEKYHWDFVQIQMNYVDWTSPMSSWNSPAKYLYEKLAELGIPAVIMEPLLGGRLSNLPDAAAARLKEQEPTKSIASWAFRFNGTFPGVLTILSGMTYKEHLEDNLDTFRHFTPLDEEELVFLEEVAELIKSYPLIPCTACNYCMPCPYGIDIPGIFKHYNNAVNGGTIARNRDQKNFKELRRKYLTSYNKAVETLRQADHCSGCNRCSKECPQHINIPHQMQRIDTYVEKLKQGKL